MRERERERERERKKERGAERERKMNRYAHLYGGAALQLFVSIRHAGFISAVSACTKTLFFTSGPAAIWRVYRTRWHGVHRLRLQLLRFIANNSFAPLRDPRFTLLPPSLPPTSSWFVDIAPTTVAFPRSSVSMYRPRKYRLVSIGSSVCIEWNRNLTKNGHSFKQRTVTVYLRDKTYFTKGRIC